MKVCYFRKKSLNFIFRNLRENFKEKKRKEIKGREDKESMNYIM